MDIILKATKKHWKPCWNHEETSFYFPPCCGGGCSTRPVESKYFSSEEGNTGGKWSALVGLFLFVGWLVSRLFCLVGLKMFFVTCFVYLDSMFCFHSFCLWFCSLLFCSLQSLNSSFQSQQAPSNTFGLCQSERRRSVCSLSGGEEGWISTSAGGVRDHWRLG